MRRFKNEFHNVLTMEFDDFKVWLLETMLKEFKQMASCSWDAQPFRDYQFDCVESTYFLPWYVWYSLEPIINHTFVDHSPDRDTNFQIYCNMACKAVIVIATVNKMLIEIFWNREEVDA